MTASGDAALFAPAWVATAPDPDDLAWAGYAFDMSGYSGIETISFTWNESGSNTDVWIGLSDYIAETWDWYALPASNLMTVDFSAHTSAAPEVMQVMVVCLGTAQWELARIDLGNTPDPPAAPTGVAASDGAYADRIAVTWTKSADATAYLVYRDDQGAEVALVGDVAAWDDTAVSDTDPHTYWVKARNSGGDSDFSASDAGYLLAGTGPAAPTGLTASDYLYGVIRLDWTKSDGATGYEVFRDSTSIDTLGDVSSYFDKGVSDNDPHTYTVRASSGTGTSGYSDPAVGMCIATPPGPGAWPQYAYDAANTGCSPNLGPTTDNLRWTVDMRALTGWDNLSVGFSGPSIAADGTIYIGYNYSHLVAISPDGELRWKYLAYMWEIGVPAIGPDGRIYICDDSSTIRCFYPSGEFCWSYQLPSDAYFGRHPAIDAAGNVYCALGDGRVYKLDGDGNVATGWPFQMSGSCEEVTSVAVDSAGTVYCAASSVVDGDAYYHAILSDGTEKFNFTSNYFWAIPTVDSALNSYYISAGWLRSVKPDGSGFNWSMSSNDTFGSVSFDTADGSIYYGTEGNESTSGFFTKLNSTGGLEWAYYTGGYIYSTPAIDLAGNVYFGSRDGYVYALDSEGNDLWSYDTGAAVDSSPAITADGCLIIGNNGGKVFCFGPAT